MWTIPLIVHLKKEAKWLKIWKKRRTGCHFKERGKLVVNSKKELINLPWLFTHPLSPKIRKGVGYRGNFLLIFWEREVGWIIKVGWMILSSNWQQIPFFLRIDSHFISFSEFTANLPLSLNVLLSIYWTYMFFQLQWQKNNKTIAWIELCSIRLSCFKIFHFHTLFGPKTDLNG